MKELDRIYGAHPFQRRTILARLARQGVSLTGLREPALALDPATEITDQNHVGGAPFVVALAQAAGVGLNDVVIDIGSGLAGSARLLADLTGCRVSAIEQDAGRHADAVALTQLTGLGDRVTLVHADATIDPSPLARADVLWGQSAWVHIVDKPAFLAKWRGVLVPGGRWALEDAYLRRSPATAAERTLLDELERSWHASLVPLHDWQTAFERIGGSIALTANLTVLAAEYFVRLLQVSAQWTPGDLTADERAGWERAQRAIGAGLVGYFRMVARLDA